MPENVAAMLQQGYARHKAGQLDDAEAIYRQVLSHDSRNVHALNLLGMLYVNSGRPAEAIAAILAALESNPDDAQAHANIALAYKDMTGFAQAEKHFRRSLALNPGAPVVYNNLGVVLREQRRREEAIRSFEQALQLDANYAECWCNLALALNDLQRFDQARQAVQRALAIDPRMPQAHNNLAEVYRGQSRFEEAIGHYRKALALNPQYAEAMLNLATAYREAEEPEAALAMLQQLLAIEPLNPKAHNALGILREQQGEREEAAACFKRAIEIAPGVAYPHYQLAQLKGRKSSDEELRAMEKLIAREDLNEDDRMYLAFGLAGAYEQRGRYEDAFAYWAEGNAIKAERAPYDAVARDELYRSSVRHSAEALQRLGGDVGFHDTRPVFIIGMPRSGTTLTDQILASHSRVGSVGEVSFAYDLSCRVGELTGDGFPRGVASLSSGQFRQLGEEFIARLTRDTTGKTFVIDKTPLNFQYVGLLAQALPDARFIHCYRDPVDNCFSIFKLPFADVQDYAHDLVALGQHYNSYRSLMNAWKELLPGRILDVCYEDTVADLEQQARRLLDFLGLEFEEQVLAFHESSRLVRTPSASQVRQPIYRDSVRAWKKYEKQLSPLIDTLQAG